MSKHFSVVGGTCVDIFAASTQPLIRHDSNPGTVSIGFGGVGRNIAENLARIGESVSLIAPFGSDPFSVHMLNHTRNIGVNVDHCLNSDDSQSPYYVSVNDSDGEMDIAVNEMNICERISPQYLKSNLDALNASDAIIIDTNIPETSLQFIASHSHSPIYADAVSCHKAKKLISILPYLYCLKVNLQEAEALTQLSLHSDLAFLRTASEHFHHIGIQFVLITLGKKGAYLSDGTSETMFGAYETHTVNANGCGDAFAAIAFNCIAFKMPSSFVLKHALAAAAITAESKQAVSDTITNQSISEYIESRRML